MGAEFQVGSLEEMCGLMCDNKVPTLKSELLSIEETIRQLKKCKSFHNGSYGEALNIAIKALEQEPKTGQWIDGKCNRCGTHAPFWAMASAYYLSEYCPHCGAKMAESEET